MSTLPDIKMGQLRNFVAVVDENGFKAAARAVFRTQPAVSLSVKELERLLGAELFEKNSQSVLTPFGQQFYAQAKELIEHYNNTIRNALSVTQLNAGEVRVALVPSLARDVLPAAIQRFTADHPQIEVWVEDGDADYIKERVLSRSVDFGCSRGGGAGDPRLAYEVIARDRLGVVCSADHPLAQLPSASWKDLAPYTIISHGFMGLLDPELVTPLLQQSRLRIANIASILALTEAGVGITILPLLSLPKNSERVRFVPLESPVVIRTLGLVQLATTSLSPAAEAFRRVLVEAIQDILPAQPG
ncbi:MAG TPA: LysR family transcriptional regulator [Ramlibacter sp.]|nr:LysR family transcriptional regulator [Ramlibacter sp.]